LTDNNRMLAFGPIPSRRLGKSLGINNIPPKICTYSCIYCQVGRTLKMQVERNAFYKPEEIFEEVKKKVRDAKTKKEPIDFLTFAPDGEATLDINLGREIELLKTLGIKIAVISNASLFFIQDVREDLKDADWVSVKLDAISDDVWHKIDRPHKHLKHKEILEGIIDFSHNFKGELMTETMLIKGINDKPIELKRIADFIVGLAPKKSYISIPTRPPAEKTVQPPDEDTINMAYQIFKEKGIATECLIGYEGNAFAFTGNIEEDLLSITSVHPMREEGVKAFLKKAGADWSVIRKLIDDNKLVELEYGDRKFYIRKLSGKKH